MQNIRTNNDLITNALEMDARRVMDSIKNGANVNVRLDNGDALIIAILNAMDSAPKNEKRIYRIIIDLIVGTPIFNLNQKTNYYGTDVYIIEYAMIQKKITWVDFFLNNGANHHLAEQSDYYWQTSDDIRDLIQRFSRAMEKTPTPPQSPRTYLNFSNLRL